MGFADDGVRRVNGCQSDRLAVLSYKRECREDFIKTGGRLDGGRRHSDFPICSEKGVPFQMLKHSPRP